MKTKILTLVLLISASMVFAQSGSITNIIPAQRTDGSMIVDITYDLAGPEPDYTITAEASFDDGVSFTQINNVTGDVGAGIVPGSGKAIVWDFGGEFPDQYSAVTQIRLTASLIPPATVTNPTTGEIWMDRNLGASQVATSSTDAAAYGDLYQWGRATEGHESRTSGTTSTNATTAVPNAGNTWDGLFITENTSPYDWLIPQDNTLWQGVSGTNNPCPTGFRLPTEAEWEAERASWASNNAAGAFGSVLKLTVGGYRNHYNGSLNLVGSYGSYWSGSVGGTYARYLYFYSSDASMNYYNRAYGFSVRCIKEPPTWSCGDNLIDERDSQTYTTVEIGSQCWMAENLNIGTMISGSSNQSQQTPEVIEKYCYDDNTSNCDTYGGLYQWNEMMQYTTTPGVQGICPTGWHLPTDAEWCTLEQEVDPTITCSSTDWRGVDGGGKLKETGTTHWSSPNIGATNSSGFTGLPGGYRANSGGSFNNLSNYGYFWSSSVSGSEAWKRALYFGNAQVNRYDNDQSFGFSVRCVQD